MNVSRVFLEIGLPRIFIVHFRCGIPDKKIQRALASMERQALHASRLTFPHPRTGESMTFEAEMPEDMRMLLGALA